MKNHLKDLVHEVAHVAHEIAHAAHDLTQNIAAIVHPFGDRVENIFKEKGISVTRENRHGNDVHNIVASSDGSFFTNNSVDFARGLLNHVLFTDNGESRIANAMSDEHNITLQRIQNPPKQTRATNFIQFSPDKNDTSNND